MNPRIIVIVILFAVIGAILDVATSHWVFQTHHDIPWSSTDMLLLKTAIWPQVLAAGLGYTGGSSILSLLVNSFGWALVGLLVGFTFRKRIPADSQQFI